MRSVFTGPAIVSGNLKSDQLQDSDVAPSLIFQGDGLLDPRLVGTIDAAPGRPIFGLYNNALIALVDATPTASAAGNLDSQAGGLVIPAGGSTVPRAVNAASQSIAVSTNVPLEVFPPGPSTSIVTVPATLDFGFTTGSITGGATALTIPAGAYKYFKKGQALLLPGAGSGGTAPLLTTVANAVAFGATTITLSNAAVTTTSSQPVGSADPTLFNLATSVTPTLSNVGAMPWIFSGCTALFDPTQGVARCLRVISSNAADGATFSVTVRGWDVYGVPMTETITLNGTTAVYGKKAWKYVNTIQYNKTGGGTTTGTITLGTGDTFGIALKSDFFEYMSIYWNAAFQPANTGWLVADSTTPATATTGDVRGTIQLGVNGAGTGYTTSPNGSIRLAAFMSVPAYNAVNANNLNYATLFGVTQNAS
jgi:hypothetical protein